MQVEYTYDQIHQIVSLDDLERIKQEFYGQPVKLEIVDNEKTLKKLSKLYQIDTSNFINNTHRTLLATAVFQKIKNDKIYNYALLIALDKNYTGKGHIHDINHLFFYIHPDNVLIVECRGKKCRKKGDINISGEIEWCESCWGDETDYNDWFYPYFNKEIDLHKLEPKMILGSNIKTWDLDTLTKGDPVLKEILTKSFRSMR